MPMILFLTLYSSFVIQELINFKFNLTLYRFYIINMGFFRSTGRHLNMIYNLKRVTLCSYFSFIEFACYFVPSVSACVCKYSVHWARFDNEQIMGYFTKRNILHKLQCRKRRKLVWGLAHRPSII